MSVLGAPSEARAAQRETLRTALGHGAEEQDEHARSMREPCYRVHMDLAAVILTALLTLAPHSRQRPPHGWEETREAYEARLGSISADIASAAEGSRERAAKLVGIAWHESGFAADVDAGLCADENRGRCDGGKAASLWQLQDGDPVRLMHYRLDRRAAAKEALRRLERSERTCAGNGVTERLAAYAGGVCGLMSAKAAARGLWASVERARRAMPVR